MNEKRGNIVHMNFTENDLPWSNSSHQLAFIYYDDTFT
jgi:hypothetical protein